MVARYQEGSHLGGYFDEFNHENYCKRSVLGCGRIVIYNGLVLVSLPGPTYCHFQPTPRLHLTVG